MAKRGIDISAHQGNIDLRALKNQIDFVIIRVGYGVSGAIDDKFTRNADLCEELGIPYGFDWYSYALDVSGAQSEASHFLNAIPPYHPTMGCWFDMEDADGYKSRKGMPSDVTLINMCYEFCEKVRNAGYYAGIYASQSWFNTKLTGDKLLKFGKWIAQWPTANGKQKGLAVDANARHDADIWQFTSAGKFSGYLGNLDTNYAYKNSFELSEQSTTEPEPITPSGNAIDLVIGVMNGEYGDGETRKNNLGQRYNEVQSIINHIYSASAEELAKEVIADKYKSGEIRKIILGGRYNEVQSKVNEILKQNTTRQNIHKGSRIRFTGAKTYSGLTLASWTHNDIFNVIEVSGDRVVIGKGSAVTAAVNIKDCELI